MKLISYFLAWFVLSSCLFSDVAQSLGPPSLLKGVFKVSSCSVPSSDVQMSLSDRSDVSSLSDDSDSFLSDTEQVPLLQSSQVEGKSLLLTWKYPFVHKFKSFFRHYFVYYLTYFLIYVFAVLFFDALSGMLLVVYFLLPRWLLNDWAVIVRCFVGASFVIVASADTIAGEAAKITFKKRMIDYANRRRNRQKILRSFGLRHSWFSFLSSPFSNFSFQKKFRLNRSYWENNLRGNQFVSYMKKQSEFSSKELLSSQLVQTQLVVRFLHQRCIQERCVSFQDLFASQEAQSRFFSSLKQAFPRNRHFDYIASGSTQSLPEKLTLSEYNYLSKVFESSFVLAPELEAPLYREPSSVRIKRYFILFYILIYLLAMLVPLAVHFGIFHAYTLNVLHGLVDLEKIAITVLVGTGVLLIKQLTKGSIRKGARYLSVRVHARCSKHQASFPKACYSDFVMQWRSYYKNSGSVRHKDVWMLLLRFTQNSGMSFSDLHLLADYLQKTHFSAEQTRRDKEFDIYRYLPLLIFHAHSMTQFPNQDSAMKDFFRILDVVNKKGTPEQIYVFSSWAEFLLKDVGVSLFILDERGAYLQFLTSFRICCPSQYYHRLFEQLHFSSSKRSAKGLILNFTLADYHVAYLFLLLVLFFAIGMAFGVVMSDATLPSNLSLPFHIIVKAVFFTVLFSSFRSMAVRLMKDPVEWGIEKAGKSYFNGYRVRKVVLKFQKVRLNEYLHRTVDRVKMKPRYLLSGFFVFLGFLGLLFMAYVADIFFVILLSFGGVVPFMSQESGVKNETPPHESTSFSSTSSRKKKSSSRSSGVGEEDGHIPLFSSFRNRKLLYRSSSVLEKHRAHKKKVKEKKVPIIQSFEESFEVHSEFLYRVVPFSTFFDDIEGSA